MWLAVGGYAHPDDWLDDVTSEQLSEIEAYDSIEPIGGFREDFRFAQVCNLVFQIAQAVYGKKGQRRSSTPADFMPWGSEAIYGRRKPVKKVQTVEEMKEVLLKAFKPKPKGGGK